MSLFPFSSDTKHLTKNTSNTSDSLCSSSALFQFPETRQYGSHMVMTNVKPDTKCKYVNIDTRFSDDFNVVGAANYNIVMPDRLTNVKSMSVVNVELPISFYNISAAIGNNIFYVTDTILGVTQEVLLPDNQYDISGLVVAINGILNTAFSGDLSYSVDACGNSVFTSVLDTYTINFNVDSSGDTKLTPKFKLGWIMGFRGLSYSFGDSTGGGAGGMLVSEFAVNLTGPRYVYLVVNEFHNGDQTSFISVLSDSTIRKNILARVTTAYNIYPYGTILPANFGNGFLTSDTRVYGGGKIDIQKLNIQIVDENGAVMDLNGEDVSICLLLELE